MQTLGKHVICFYFLIFFVKQCIYSTHCNFSGNHENGQKKKSQKKEHKDGTYYKIYSPGTHLVSRSHAVVNVGQLF